MGKTNRSTSPAFEETTLAAQVQKDTAECFTEEPQKQNLELQHWTEEFLRENAEAMKALANL